MEKAMTMAELTAGGRTHKFTTPSLPVPALATSGRRAEALAQEQPDHAAAESLIARCLTGRPLRPTGPNSGRNDWLAGLTHHCNKAGVPQAALLTYALTHWQEPDFETTEIRRIITGIYQRKAAQYDTLSPRPQLEYAAPAATSTATPQPAPPDGVAGDVAAADGNEPPRIPRAVYEALPDFLRRACQPYWEREHELDVLLTALLVALSGVFRGVGGAYGERWVGLNLFAFIAALAASGKGLMGWAERLLRVPHRQRVEASRRARAQHEAELAEWQHQKRPGEPLVAPPDQRLLFPADTSAAALLQQLVDNDGCGVICESEADALTQANSREWGGFSTMLRRAAHHEPVNVSRKTSGPVEIPHPALSVVLTGTPQQVQRMMSDVENGLVSRFLFYAYAGTPGWVNQFRGGSSLDGYYAQLGEELAAMMAQVGEEVTVRLTPGQEAQHTAVFGAWADELAQTQAPTVHHSSLRRLGLSAFHLAMLLTVLRRFEDGEEPAGTLVCADEDFATAMQLISVFRQHTTYVLTRLLPSGRPADGPGGRQAQRAAIRRQAQALQQRGLSVRDIQQQLGVSKSTVHRLLHEYDDGAPQTSAA
jgi:hypothetical protein